MTWKNKHNTFEYMEGDRLGFSRCYTSISPQNWEKLWERQAERSANWPRLQQCNFHTHLHTTVRISDRQV